MGGGPARIIRMPVFPATRIIISPAITLGDSLSTLISVALDHLFDLHEILVGLASRGASAKPARRTI